MELDKIELKNSKYQVFVSIWYDTNLEATIDRWVGPFETKENFQVALMLVLENIKKFNSKKWLADLSKIEGDFQESKDFIINKIIPEAMATGLQFEALILPHDIFSMLSVQEAMEVVNTLEIRTFGNLDEGKLWLQSQVPTMAE